MSTLREELASLKIDRVGGRRPMPAPPPRRSSTARGGSGAIRLALWAVPLATLGAGGYFGYERWREVGSKPVVATAVVQAMTTGEAEKLLSAKGYLKSRSQAAVGAKAAGRVEEIRVEEGSRVRKGDVIAVLDHADVDAQLASARAAVARAEADLLDAEADLDEKGRKARRADRLAERGMISVEDRDQIDVALRRAHVRIASLKATIDLERQAVRQSEVMLENMTIRAPFAGTVVKKSAEVGEMMNGGGPALATVADLARMDVETDVTEGLLARLAVGQPAEVSVSAVPTRRYRGRLRQVIPLSDRARGTVKVMVEFLEPDEHLFPELVATVHFLPDSSRESPDAGKPRLFVPRAAIVAEGGRSFAYRLDAAKVAHKVAVETVAANDDLARVDVGLKAGDSVVLDPPKTLRDGKAVTAAE